MKKVTSILPLCIGLLCIGSCIWLCTCKDLGAVHADRSPEKPANYQLVKDWPRLPEGYVLGNPSGIGIDSAQHVFVFHRASKKWPLLLSFSTTVIPENTILELDRNSGKIINNWGAGLFIMPHSLTVDKDNHIWVTDVGLQQVLKFSHEGVLLMSIGEAGVAGTDSAHFDRPTDVAVAPDGSVYVSEYVADRENSRIQVFDANGKFLKEWKDDRFGKLYAIRFDKTKKDMVAVDYITDYISPKGSDIILFDPNGKLIAQFGRSGSYNGPVCRYHDLSVDNEGNIYVGDILGNQIQKFKRVVK